jgi:hypothetical protein
MEITWLEDHDKAVELAAKENRPIVPVLKDTRPLSFWMRKGRCQKKDASYLTGPVLNSVPAGGKLADGVPEKLSSPFLRVTLPGKRLPGQEPPPWPPSEMAQGPELSLPPSSHALPASGLEMRSFKRF